LEPLSANFGCLKTLKNRRDFRQPGDSIADISGKQQNKSAKGKKTALKTAIIPA